MRAAGCGGHASGEIVSGLVSAHLRLLVVAIAMTLLAAGAGLAQEPAPPPDDAELRELLRTLEDEEQRQRLIGQLRALLEIEREVAEVPPEPAPTTPEGAVAWLVQELSARTAIATQTFRNLFESLQQLPFLVIWLETQVADPQVRQIWADVTREVLIIVGAGIGAMLLASWSLRRARDSLRQPVPDSYAARVLKALLRLVVELVPVAVFAAVAYGTMAGIGAPRLTRFVAIALINAVVIVRTAVAILRLAFAHDAPNLRLFPLSEAAARFAYRWFRRLISVGVYGYMALTAARLLGLPAAAHGFLLHLLGIALVVLAIVMVLRCRKQVAATIAVLDDPAWGDVVRVVPWTTIAAVWHVLAVLWVLVAYAVWSVAGPDGSWFMIRATVVSIAIVLAAWFAMVHLERYLPQPEPPPPPSEEEEGEEAPPERRLPTGRGLLRAGAGVLAVLAVLEAWSFGTLGWLTSETGMAVAARLFSLAVIVLLAFGLARLANAAIGRYLSATDAEGNIRRTSRQRTLMTIARYAILVFLSVVASLMVLSELGLDITPLLAGAGVVGLAIGFGSQKLVQDIITGLFILLGDTVRVGDVVQVAGLAGVVESVSMRAVTLRDYGGNVHTIPYSSIDSVTNMTKDFSFAVFDIGVAYREDVDQVMRVMREVAAAMQRDREYRRLILEPLEIAGVDKFDDSAVVVRARWKTMPIRQWQIGREYRRRLKRRFDELGIEIPFPHQTLYFGVDKEGRAPPAWLRLQHEQATGSAATGGEAPPCEPAAAAATRG
jgi:moderate conductance mechanosensitive channel